MVASALSGPCFTYGPLAGIAAAIGGGPVPDYNLDSGPGAEYQGDGVIDARFFFPKDKVTGFTGVVPCHFNTPAFYGVTGIPAAASALNLAGNNTASSGTPFTLAGASVGVAINVPIRPFSAAMNGLAPVTAAICLDFGFSYGTCTAGSGTITVATGYDFFVGMPLVIAGVGNSAGTASLLTQVTGVNNAANTITVFPVPLATNAAVPIGTGDIWGPSVVGFPLPMAALPYLAAGPGLWLDARQTITRGVRITGTTGGTGGTVTVRGWDIYHQPMSETITVGAGAVTGWGRKTFKYIGSVTPNFTDGGHFYTVGTSDVFGLCYRSPIWDQTNVFWAGSFMSVTQGYLPPDATTPATATTGDVRGTVQCSGYGPGSGIGGTVSNGALVSLVMTGNRYTAALFPLVNQATAATAANPVPLYGVTQA